MSDLKRLIPYSMAPVKVSGELQLTEHGQILAKQLLEQYEKQSTLDAIYAEYVDGAGVKYAGTLYRVSDATREQEG